MASTASLRSRPSPKNAYEYCQEIITKRQSITLENQRATSVSLVPLLAVAGNSKCIGAQLASGFIYENICF